MSLPTHDQVLELPVVTQLRVDPQDIDENGHLTTVRYFELTARGLGTACEQAGLGPTYILERNLTIFTAEHHLRYVTEVRTDDHISVHVQLLERSGKALHAMAYLLDRTGARLSYVLESTLLHINLADRRPADFPPDITDRLDEMITTHSVDWDAPVCGTMGVRR